MEVIAFFLIFSILLAFFANDPLHTPFQALAATGVVVFFALVGGASFLNDLFVAIQKQMEEPPEDEDLARPSLRRAAGHGPAEFDIHDKFYHAHGLCCSEKGHCHSCLKQHAERFKEEHAEDGLEFDRQLKQALAE
ncbi:hypothetical protein FSPOR_11443 [Fusarium sporotrichioides]|uniref:Uncharacterized protein n=1 Tax=Fusarium sporotrichioides TaxID=5514 RepID=A0A395RGY8_FUSSP|nr:hypothetical protein FSPOR_11443 [Fusarium sporotrichioides]